jgi:glucoamylase
MIENGQQAPGHPGIPARWTSSAKSGIGTALNPTSRVWFTLSHGIFDEIYYPRVDQACIRDMGLIVTDGESFFSEEKRDADHQVEYIEQGIPAYRLINNDKQDRFRITKEIVTDPQRDVVLQRTHFEPLQGTLKDYHIYVLLAPHLGNQGMGNNAWVGDYKGVPMLFAERDSIALALASDNSWLKRSVGFVGFSDGWQDLHLHNQMTWVYRRAENGNVALIGEVDLVSSSGIFVLALGFGLNYAEAGQRALISIQKGFNSARTIYIQEWKRWKKTIAPLEETSRTAKDRNCFEISAAVLKIHEAKRFPGGLIASLSVPWGFSKGDDDLGGYHLVWPRDLVEAAGGLLAIGAHKDAHRVLDYLKVTQEPEGNWPQNMWLDGRPYWSGIQMDETAFPILLIDLAKRSKALGMKELANLWQMVRSAASFLVRNGPVTQQDRWEEDPGFSPFTLAIEIAALLVAGDIAEERGEIKIAAYLRDTADVWNANIERWTFVTGTELAEKFGVEGYYVRIAPPEVADAASPADGFVPIKNRPPDQSCLQTSQIVSPDALALVRFGLRAPDDQRILNTIRVIDGLLKIDTPSGPAWHRYNDDGYGENDDGNPFDGTGVGRAWPLLTGERAHYELAAGNKKKAEHLLATMQSFANPSGMIPEQIWDSHDLPEKELFFGKPSGSAMPLVWAHAEYLKLLRSLQDGRVYDTPAQTVKRYLEDKTGSRYAIWRFNHKAKSIEAGKILRIEVLSPAKIHWSSTNWKEVRDSTTQETGLGLFYVDLPTDKMAPDSQIVFTIYWLDQDQWEGRDYQVDIKHQE